MPGRVIYNRLANNTSAVTRVYPVILPQTPTYPAVTYQTISVTRIHNMGSDANVQIVTMQVDCWGTTRAQVRTLADEVASRLSRFKGIVSAFEVQDIVHDNQSDAFEPDTNIHRITQDYRLFLSTI